MLILQSIRKWCLVKFTTEEYPVWKAGSDRKTKGRNYPRRTVKRSRPEYPVARSRNWHFRIQSLEEDVVSIPADPEVKNFSFTVVNDEVYYRENSVMNRMELPAMTAERVKGMVKIRDVTNELIQCQMEEGSDEQITKLQGKLNEEYDYLLQQNMVLSAAMPISGHSARTAAIVF